MLRRGISIRMASYIMAKTGARGGSIVNITQMVAMIGQQTIRVSASRGDLLEGLRLTSSQVTLVQ